MDLEDQLSRVALAFGIGLLIGLERGWRTREAAPGSRTAGIRTFAITGLLGGIVGNGELRRWRPGSARRDRPGHRLCHLRGGHLDLLPRGEQGRRHVLGHHADCRHADLCARCLRAIGSLWVAAAASVAATAILAAREELHGWVGSITWPELRSGLVLLAMTFIALPIMPTAPIGGVNLREVWIIAIVLASVSFLGYAAVKRFGQRGVLLAGALGGLVSSTAVTIANSRRAAAHEGSPHLLAAGVAIASAVMYVRVVVIVGALKPSLLVLSRRLSRSRPSSR